MRHRGEQGGGITPEQIEGFLKGYNINSMKQKEKIIVEYEYILQPGTRRKRNIYS